MRWREIQIVQLLSYLGYLVFDDVDSCGENRIHYSFENFNQSVLFT